MNKIIGAGALRIVVHLFVCLFLAKNHLKILIELLCVAVFFFQTFSDPGSSCWPHWGGDNCWLFFPVACGEVANLMYLHLLCLIRVKYILMAESYFRNLAFDAIDQHKTSISCSIVFENSAYATFVLWVIWERI